ncbi:hypothetical protein SCP_0301970 [Sparassis crispa]|uniref:Uncharacterized protein n=1 Tax=Sparassis crispa TaxID=139825 RepID=A0A401GE76_9APHY|nr:hypothetical protein SCP_0301970 [Sparassis crispa]GBE80482.1 hypothetical protein SCP_0301970 [Sparassis crispa]
MGILRTNSFQVMWSGDTTPLTSTATAFVYTKMPFFPSSSAEGPTSATPDPSEEAPPSRSRSIFSRNSRSPDYQPSTAANSTRSGNGSSRGFFSQRRSSSSNSGQDLRNHPSIVGARQKVADAVAAERDVDQALRQARASVRAAREHVRLLEREAKDEARRAKAKQAELETVSKSAKNLGRFG